MKNCILSTLGVLALLAGCSSTPAHKADLSADEARAYFEVLRADFKAGKVRAINQVMKLTVAEANSFWPIYRQYEKDLAEVGDRRMTLISGFLVQRNAGTLTDPDYTEMAAKWLQNNQDRLELWKKYHQQISAAVSPLRAAQFLQVENQMAIYVDLKIASEIPVIGVPVINTH